jgi:hypothetical protein
VTAPRIDFWRCDNCDTLYPPSANKWPVRIEQRTERIYGTEASHRPVEQLTFCQRCVERLRAQR